MKEIFKYLRRTFNDGKGIYNGDRYGWDVGASDYRAEEKSCSNENG